MSKRKERKAAEAAEHERNALEAERERLTSLVEAAKEFDGVTASEMGGCAVSLKAGEKVYVQVADVALIEPRRGAGHWEGRSQAVSVHIPGTKSMRYRVGGSRGHFVQGEEQPTPIDEGTFVVTSQRAVFLGSKQTREWLWSKLIGMTHGSDMPWTTIAVSNRQKTSGVYYGAAIEDTVRFRLDLAVAHANGTVEELVQQLEAELAALPPTHDPVPSSAITTTETDPQATAGTVGPAMAPETETATSPAAWHADPTGRHEMRYWDGSKWTAYVADQGVQNTDPV